MIAFIDNLLKALRKLRSILKRISKMHNLDVNTQLSLFQLVLYPLFKAVLKTFFFFQFRYSDSRDKLFIIIGSLVAFITGFSWNLLTIAFGDIVDVFVHFESSYRLNATTNSTDAEFMKEVYVFSGSLFILWLLNSICNYLIMVLFPLAAINQIKTIKLKYFSSLLKQDIQWFDCRDTDFASTVTTDLKRIEDGLNEKLGLAIYNASTALIAILVAFAYGWKLTLIIISLLPFLAFGTSVMNKVQATFARKEVEAYSKAGSVAEEVISAIRTVLAFGGQEKEVKRYESHLWPALKSGIKRNFMTGLGNGLMFSCLYGGLALGIWFGVQMIIQSRDSGSNEYTIGTIVIVFWCVSGAGFSIGGAAPHFEAVSVARATAAKVFAIIERKPKIDISCESGLRPEEFNANIEFQDLEFSYPSRPEVKVLNGFSLNIRSGESVALVGPSGCGKSTLVQLIQRFYDPQKGRVLIDGNDIKSLNLGFLRQKIGVVGQEPVLFDTSIWQNIALGSHSKYVDQKDIENSSREANAHQFIIGLPKKYETYCGDRGRQLSGGQKQRIAIARALINCPKILILDEATSALDLQSESLVQTALERAALGRTTVIVAHRLSTIVNCTRIVFISEGKVKEIGTHLELMEKKGFYYNLVLKQQISEQTYGSEPESDYQLPVQEQVEEEEELLFEEDEEQVLKKFSQKRLWHLLSEDKYYVFFGLFLSLLYGLIVPIYAFIFGAFVEVFAQTTDPKEIWMRSSVFTYYYIVIAFCVGFISVTQMTVLGVAAERLTLRLRRMAFEAIIRQEIAFFDKQENSTGALCARLSSDAANVQGASGSRMAIILQAFSTFLASAVLGFVLNWQLSLVASIFIPFILIGSAISASVDNWESKSVSLEKSTKIASEALTAIRTIASLHREKYFIVEFEKIVENNYKTSQKKCIVRAFTLSFALSIVFLSYAVVFLYGGHLAVARQLESGNFFIIIETLIYGSMTVGQSSVFTSDYRKAKMAAANIFRLIDRRSQEVLRNGSIRPEECKGDLSFQRVRFCYPNRKECQVLKGLTFEVTSGQTVALVGASGCGKSTSIQLLEKFYDVICGQITLDGNNLKDLNTKWLREEMALVSQEPNLFSYSIRDNIAYGLNSREVSFEEIVRVSQKANIHQFIRDLPQQYDTYVGSKGTQLSGGQKQRIAIARALIRDPKILLLDEATSALDSESEKMVQEALEEASKDRTSLVIAHRLSTVRNADKIVVIQKGVVVEEGTHEELIQRKGFYYDLNQFQ